MSDPRAEWMGGGPFRGGRMRRGEIRTAVLGVLTEGPAHGYEIIKTLEERSGGAWRPSPGSVYPLLQLLEDENLVRSSEQEGKRVFELTDAGREEAETRKAADPRAERLREAMADDPDLGDFLPPGPPWGPGAGFGPGGRRGRHRRMGMHAHGELRGAIGNLAGAAVQVAQVGTPEQVAKAIDILGKARRDLYQLLAEE